MGKWVKPITAFWHYHGLRLKYPAEIYATVDRPDTRDRDATGWIHDLASEGFFVVESRTGAQFRPVASYLLDGVATSSTTPKRLVADYSAFDAAHPTL
jgi:hypothetical protein